MRLSLKPRVVPWLLAASISAPVAARDPARLEASFLARPDAVVLHNRAEQSIRFLFGPETGQLREQELGAQEARQFSESRANSYLIEIATDGKAPLRYKLDGSRRYQVYWNEPRKAWDVLELKTAP